MSSHTAIVPWAPVFPEHVVRARNFNRDLIAFIPLDGACSPTLDQEVAVSNGDFEAGALTGFTATNGPAIDTADPVLGVHTLPASWGTYYAFFGNPVAQGTIAVLERTLDISGLSSDLLAGIDAGHLEFVFGWDQISIDSGTTDDYDVLVEYQTSGASVIASEAVATQNVPGTIQLGQTLGPTAAPLCRQIYMRWRCHQNDSGPGADYCIDNVQVWLRRAAQTPNPKRCDRSAYSIATRSPAAGDDPGSIDSVHDMSGGDLDTFTGGLTAGPNAPVSMPYGFNPDVLGGGLRYAHRNGVFGGPSAGGIFGGGFLLEDFTIAFWMLTDSTDGTGNSSGDNWKNNPHIVGKLVTGDDDHDFAVVYRGGSGLVQFVTGRPPGGGSDHVLEASIDLTASGTPPASPSDWHHVAVVRRRSDGFKGIYIDGVLDQSATNAAGWHMSNSEPLTIGTNNANGSAFRFDGWLAYFMMWKRALTAGQINSLWAPETRFLELERPGGPAYVPAILAVGDPLVQTPPDPEYSIVNVTEFSDRVCG